MAGISWPEGVSNGTNLLISNGTNLLISSGTNLLISSGTKATSGGVLGADLQPSNGTNFLISNGTKLLIPNVIKASSGGVLGADLQPSSGTNFLISNGTNFPTSNVTKASWGADVQPSLFAVTYSLVLVLGLAGGALSLSLSLLPCRVKPLSHSYVLLLHLALLDALFLAVLPLHIHSQLLGGTWPFGDTACGVTRGLCCLHTSLSVAFFSCLGGDVWLAALRPFTSIRLRATHYLLVATALWLVALAGTVPLVLHSTGVRSCFGSFPASWAQPTAPQTILAFVFGVVVPFCIILLGLPLAAGSVWRSGRRAARRKALGTICIVLGICALCFLPHLLTQLLEFLLGLQGMHQEPFPSLVPRLQRVSEALASCSCVLNPLLYRFHSSSSAWRCPCRLSLRPKRVFTICDQNFGDPSWDCRPGQRREKGNPWGWNRLSHSRYTRS